MTNTFNGQNATKTRSANHTTFLNNAHSARLHKVAQILSDQIPNEIP